MYSPNLPSALTEKSYQIGLEVLSGDSLTAACFKNPSVARAPLWSRVENFCYSNFMSYNRLSAEEERVIVGKGTERPFTGEYDRLFSPGTFVCRRCNNPL